MQLGDVKKTYADIESSKKDLKFQPKVSLQEGLENFVSWFKYYTTNYNIIFEIFFPFIIRHCINDFFSFIISYFMTIIF